MSTLATILSALLLLLLLAVPDTAWSQHPDSTGEPPRVRDMQEPSGRDGPPGIRDMETSPRVEDMAALVPQLDSGSRAFEAGRLHDARRHHLRAAELAPDLTSAWFGLFMVEDSLGNDDAADSALMQVRRISPDAIPPELRERLPEPEP